MLIKRILTSLVLAPAALALVFYTPLELFSIIAGGLVLLSAWEWSAFASLNKGYLRSIYVALMAGLLYLANHFLPIETLWQNDQLVTAAQYIFVLSTVWWLVATLLVWTYPNTAKAWHKGVIPRAIAGVITLIPMWLALNVLRSSGFETDPMHGSILIMVVLGIVWSTDIGAYFSGKNFGKNKLMPLVSPNKTIEGLIGGIACSVVFVITFCYFNNQPISMWSTYAVMAIGVAVFSAVGDLLESMFKREVGLKDSGSCLPGHGGILDRIDSLTAAAPIFTAFYIWILVA